MIIRQLGLQDYLPIYQAMSLFTEQRCAKTQDELWVLEHRPVFTLGKAGKISHLLQESAIPLVRTDRGGQITYHGPGQLVIYTLIDFQRRGISVRALIERLQQAIVAVLKLHGMLGKTFVERPGVYIQGKKIASLGLRIRKGGVYHGLSVNVDMDLSPFSLINPCGYAGLEMTQMKQWKPDVCIKKVAQDMVQSLEAIV